MSYTVLARRYRSATFDEVIGQNQVAQTLTRAIETGRVAHAYLFCGARGTGKTSTARILAKCLNCLKRTEPSAHPCNECDSCTAIARGQDIDVIEIDAASNTGVDNVREIISNASFRPARARFKVYIIDEVHMLSKSAFNALLKILEEPPSHVKFILATTEPEKVLATILSRCQRYDFRNISTKEIAAHLKSICKQEKMAADDDAIFLIAKSAAGSMRDGLSLLERLLSAGESKLTVKVVEQLMGLPRSVELLALSQAIGESNVKQTLEQTDAMLAAGMSADSLMSALADHLRNLLIIKTCGAQSGLIEAEAGLAELTKQAEKFDAIALTQDITILEELRRQLRQGHGGRALLDATLVRLALASQFTSISDLLGRIEGESNSTTSAAAPAAEKKKFAEPVKIQPPIASEIGAPTYVNSDIPPAMAIGRISPSPGTPGEGRGEGLSAPQTSIAVETLDTIAEVVPKTVINPIAAPVYRQTPPERPAAAESSAPARITPEMTAELEKDPLVRAVILELGGRIVKVE
jgi:DNA polymerase-3 subunit gamma/tau